MQIKSASTTQVVAKPFRASARQKRVVWVTLKSEFGISKNKKTRYPLRGACRVSCQAQSHIFFAYLIFFHRMQMRPEKRNYTPDRRTDGWTEGGEDSATYCRVYLKRVFGFVSVDLP